MANVGKHSCRYILGTLQRGGIEAGEPCDSESILVPHSVKTGFPCQTKHIYLYLYIYIAIGIYIHWKYKWWYILPILKYIEFGVSYFYEIYYNYIILKRSNQKYVSLIYNYCIYFFKILYI